MPDKSVPKEQSDEGYQTSDEEGTEESCSCHSFCTPVVTCTQPSGDKVARTVSAEETECLNDGHDGKEMPTAAVDCVLIFQQSRYRP